MESSIMTKRARDEECKLPSPKIMDIVTEIRNYDGPANRRTEYFEKKYPEFVTNYVSLFTMACEPDFDIERLRYMLDLKNKIDQNKVSFEAASREVGQKMFDVYVKDKVNDKM